MYLSELVGGLRRRWWALVIGLLGTAAITYTAFTLVPPKQEAQASLLILPPARVAQEAGNPYLALGGLEPAADMLAAAMNSGTIHESLAPPDGPGEFEVSRDMSSSGPMLLVEVSEEDPDRAMTLLDSVIDAMPDVLKKLQLQVNVRNADLLSLTEVTRDAQPEPSIKGQLRVTLVAAAGGLAITILGTNMLDGLLMRRSARKSEARSESEEISSSPPTLGAAESSTFADPADGSAVSSGSAPPGSANPPDDANLSTGDESQDPDFADAEDAVEKVAVTGDRAE